MKALIIYAKFAPYHISRLEETGRAGRKNGNELFGIEIASLQKDYRWPHDSNPGKNYTRITLFSKKVYSKLSYRDIKQALYKVLEKIKPDVVVMPGWGFKESLAGLSWCLINNVPRVVISDSMPKNNKGLANLAKKRIKSLLVKRFQAGLVGGRSHIRYLAELGIPRQKCFVGCDVVDNKFFARESRYWQKRQKKTKNEVTLLSCLRFLPCKNILTVLNTLAKQQTQWNWIIVGYGQEKRKIEKQIKKFKLEEKIRFLGYVDYFELPRIYAQADVYLQPSLHEPWGLAVNEAMACGLPVLVSNKCGCHEDLVKEGVNGFVFDPTKENSLADTLERLLVCKKRWDEMGRFSWEIIMDWGTDLFARNFWKACEATVSSHIPKAGC